MPALEQLFLRELEREIEIALLQRRVFDVGAGAAERRVGVAGPGQVQPLIQEMFLIELGQVGQQLMRIVKAVVDVAIDQSDALLAVRRPAGRGDGGGAFLADVDLLESVDCLNHCFTLIPDRDSRRNLWGR